MKTIKVYVDTSIIGGVFDCVEMKRKGAKLLQKKLAGLTLEEELKFWAEKTNELKQAQKRSRLNKEEKD